MKINGNTRRNLRIGTDVDDTKLDFHGGLIAHYAALSGRKFRYEDFHTYNLAEVAGISDDEAQAVYDTFKLTSGFTEMPPLPGVSEALRQIAQIGADFFVITAREDTQELTTRSCIERHFDTPMCEYHFCKSPSISWAEVPKKKADKIRELNLDCMIEDSAWNSIVIAENGMRVFMPPRPWNAHVKHDNIVRCDWPEIPGHLRRYVENGYNWE